MSRFGGWKTEARGQKSLEEGSQSPGEWALRGRVETLWQRHQLVSKHDLFRFVCPIPTGVPMLAVNTLVIYPSGEMSRRETAAKLG